MSVIVGAIRARPSPEIPVSAPESVPELSKMTMKELLALCSERGLDAPARAKKADLIEVIEASYGRD